METFAALTIACGILSLLCLLMLHIKSPEFDPGWRMISEYALGKHKWMIRCVFIFWGLSSVFLSVLLWNTATSTWATVGVVLLLLSAIGAIMGGLFDIKHKWHGLSFALGVPTLPVAALLISYHLTNLNGWHEYSIILLVSAHATWISLVLMAVAMMMMFASFKKAGIVMDKNAAPPETLPAGVTAYGGYTNRLLVFSYILWLLVVAAVYLLL